MRDLIDKLNYYNKMYDAGTPVISDKEYDDLYFELEKMEKETGIIYPDSPTQTIHYDVVTKLNKVTHNHQMLSLAKTKDWNNFINYFQGKDVVNMLKMDGLTCSLTYRNGELVAAETRGNGEIGEDILHNAKVIPSIPKHIYYTDELIIDGEIICKLDDFQEFSNEYANARNFASGSIRLLDSSECAKRKLTFVVWNVIKGFDNENSFFTKLAFINTLGFIVVPCTVGFHGDVKEYLVNQAKELNYPIDGLVGRFNDISYGNSLGSTDHHNKAAYAFKFYDEEYETTLRDIEWSMGKTGVLTPVAIYDDVVTEDSVINRASLHNLSIMKQLLGQPYHNQNIRVAKMNMIIPQVMWGDKDNSGEYFEIPTECPICGKPTMIKDDFLYCTNAQCDGKFINQLEHYCGKKGLDIKGISKATLEKLIDWGWLNSISDIYLLENHKADWITKDGFGEKSVTKILTAIEESKSCELWKYISAIGIPMIGTTYAKEIVKHFNTWGDFRYAIETGFNFSSYEGFGDILNENIHKFDYEEADFIHDHYLKTFCNKVETNTQSKISGKTFCITGKLSVFKNRDEMATAILDAGGKVVGSISGKTDYLITNDTTSGSAKNLKAQQLGIPIITEEELIALL